MDQPSSPVVEVRRRGGFEFDAVYASGGSLRITEPPPLGDGAAPNPAAVLASAVAGCLAASLTFCLHKSRVEPRALAARATPVTDRNERGRLRIVRIDVEIDVEVEPADEPRLRRCVGLFEEFCTVTQSVRAAIPVHVTVRAPDGRRLGPAEVSVP